jgi:glucose/arabinose dehydrogenase
MKKTLLCLSVVLGLCFAGLKPLEAAEVDTSEMKVSSVPAFTKLGKFDRPIVLTNANDGTNRIFLAAQKGKIFVFENDQDVSEKKTFLDIDDRVHYYEKQNEEGLLGLAFHPKYKENGEFFVFYTTEKEEHTTVISRFKVSKDDPNKADPESEEEIFRLKEPFWNHNGGTLAFGPDGYLYVCLGDGGFKNDSLKNGQNLKTLHGSILRIDVDQKTAARRYGIPKDNPFVNKKDAQPEIYAYGIRNVWRLAFDPKTGQGWFGDVGQDLWEEVNLLKKGANYGWSIREAMHPFGEDGVEARADLMDPIWEYDHKTGKSITGGNVYRGSKVKALNGYYIYADYVTGIVYGLKYDFDKKAVTENRKIPGSIHPVMSFGQDEEGEVYFLTVQGDIHRFEAK